MTDEEVKQLHSGDEVYWKDPCDEPECDCSRHIIIRTIEVKGDVICISHDEGDLECFPWELS